MLSALRPAITLLLLFTLVTGFAYPLAVTAAAQAIFPWQAHGSIVVVHGRAVGSNLVGQHFGSPHYFWGRPSTTGPSPYNGAASTGSNLGPTNPALQTAVHGRVQGLRAADPKRARVPVPVDLATASGSGLDPHISPASALYQVERVARGRGLPADRIRALVGEHTEGRTLGVLGEPRVHVLRLNLALDELARLKS